MSTITTRTSKGSPLSWSEMDANLTNLNNDKVEASALASYETTSHAASTYASISYISATYSPITTTVSKDTATGAAFMPVGTTAQRPTGSLGYLRYNNTLNQFEGYGASGWGTIGGGSGATGGGTDKVFVETDVTITTDYTITTNKNAMTAGPVTINSGITVTVPSGSTWTIV